MATPVAHCLAGLSIFYVAGQAGMTGRKMSMSALLILLLVSANLPDFDFLPGILFGGPGIFHRQFSHSLVFCLAASCGLLIYLKLTRTPSYILISFSIFVAMLSHLFIDWLSLDVSEPVGIELWWPFSTERIMSDPVVFLGARRVEIFSRFTMTYNLFAVAWEVIVLAPVLALSMYLSKSVRQRCPYRDSDRF